MKRTVAVLLWALAASAGIAESKETAADEIVNPEDLWPIETTPLPPHDLDGWKDWETWEPPAKIAQIAPFYKAGYDHDGLPVYVMEFGKWNYREISSLSKDEVVVFQKYYEKMARHVVQDGMAEDSFKITFHQMNDISHTGFS